MDQRTTRIEQDIKDIVHTRVAIAEKLEMLEQQVEQKMERSKVAVRDLVDHTAGVIAIDGQGKQRLLESYGTTSDQFAADIKTYPDAGHSFANKLPGQPLLRITGFGYNETTTQDAYQRVIAWAEADNPVVVAARRTAGL